MGQWNTNIHDTEVEEFAAAWVRFENGTRMVMKSSWCMHMDTLGGTILLGTKAGLRVGTDNLAGPKGVWMYRDEFGAVTDVEFKNLTTWSRPDLFALEDEAFARAVRAGGPSPVDPQEFLITNVIIQGLLDSAAQGGAEVTVKAPDFDTEPKLELEEV
jgi:predicted dehydrogenase